MKVFHSSLLPCLLFLLPVCLCAESSRWTRLEHCELVERDSNDGDSFAVKHRGNIYRFRLYFVDTPETGLFYPKRVQSQAEYFQCTTRQTLKLGHESTRFTRDFLGRDFTVYTLWEDAWGTGKRYAAIVYVARKNLAEELVKSGYVRIHGFQAPSAWPGGDSSRDFNEHLRKLERKAKRDGIGGWRFVSANAEGLITGDEQEDESVDPVSDSPVVDGDSAGNSLATGARLNVNRATPDELQAIPGVGPVTADRIIASRPYEKLEDLLNIQGIGPGTLKKISPYLSVEHVDVPDSATIPHTASIYLADPYKWENRQISLSLGDMVSLEISCPEGFVAFEANTVYENQQGGKMRVYLPVNLQNSATQYFKGDHKELMLTLFFFHYQGQWVTVYRPDLK